MKHSGKNLFRNQPTHSGFTLVELMCVVAIMSVMASVAMPGMMNYVRKARSAEANFMLRNIYDAEVAWSVFVRNKAARGTSDLIFNSQGVGCNFSTGPNCWSFTYSNAYDGSQGIGRPPRGRKVLLTQYPAPGVGFDANPYDYYKAFGTIGVNFDSPAAFAYRVSLGAGVASGLVLNNQPFYHSFFAEAYGDLDADGILSTFRRIGYLDRSGSMVGGSGIYSLNPHE